MKENIRDTTLRKKLIVLQQQINALKIAAGLTSADLPLVIDSGTGILSIPVADINNDGYLSAINFLLFSKMWNPLGNDAAGGDFIGTNNAQPLIFKTNGVEVGRVTGDGKFNWNLSQSFVAGIGSYNFSFGFNPIMSGASNYCLIGGFSNIIASGVIVGVAIGRQTVVNYNYGMAVNSSSIANGQGAFAANNCQVNSFFGAGFGLNNEIATDASNPTVQLANNRIFVIGNGSSTGNRHNALTVLHGSDVINGGKPLFGFNTLLPTSTVSVGGSFGATYVAKTANYTATELDYTIHFTANTSTFTLPTAVGCTGRIYVAKNTSGNVLTLATTSAQTIDGAAPTTLADGVAGQFQSTGANWIKIN